MNKPNLHWKSLEKRTIYKNPWVEIYSEDLELPGEYILEDFVTIKFQDWAAVVALTKDMKVVMIKQYRHAIKGVYYELPCGIIDEGETNEQGVLRELLEETGYGSKNKPEFLAKTCPSSSKINNWSYCYILKEAQYMQPQVLDPSENIEVVLIELKELKKMIAQGLIIDSFMIANIYLALDKLNFSV